MPATGSTWTVAACASPYGSDICAVTGGAAPSRCAWTVCAGGTGAGSGAGQTRPRSRRSPAVTPAGRSRASTARLLGISGTTPVTSLSALLNNWGGCGSDGQLGSCGLASSAPPQPRRPRCDLLRGDPRGRSRLCVRRPRAGIELRCHVRGSCDRGVWHRLPGDWPHDGHPAVPRLLRDDRELHQDGHDRDHGIRGWRPFQWVTLGLPTGEVQRLLQFTIDPYNNQNFATEANEISIYQV